MNAPRASGAKYLIRFDDICPGMDWAKWSPVEELMVAHGVKPILAVVPDNRDPQLDKGPMMADFWDRVRAWQAQGWAIALHGYQHLYVNRNPGILGLNQASEFAGLGYQEQFDKLGAGLEIFAREGVRADAFVAPGHSFDWNTVRALKALGVTTLSDGFALGPYRDDLGTTWVPQQIALLRRLPFGVWTFCYHSNEITPFMEGLRRNLPRLRPGMITLQEAAALGTHPRTAADGLVGLVRSALSGLRHLKR